MVLMTPIDKDTYLHLRNKGYSKEDILKYLTRLLLDVEIYLQLENHYLDFENEVI